MATVLIRGSGDVGSAVAHRLFQLSHVVVIHDDRQPAYTRRRMAFTDAVFDRKAELAGVYAKRADNRASLWAMLKCRQAIPVVLEDLQQAIRDVQPDVLVDARMRKRATPELLRGLAALTIGLGPNFEAGTRTDIAIETARGEALGQILRTGTTLPLIGEPQAIEGYGRDRYVYAPTGGVFLTAMQIGDSVQAGEEVGTVGGVPLYAPLTGRLRGLTRSGVAVETGAKVIEVDPRGDRAVLSGIGERPQRIADAVAEALTQELPNRVNANSARHGARWDTR
jgi:xanthine dehydrogenase accessory factor